MLDGIAKPIPTLPPDLEKIAVLMPMSRPLMSMSAAAGIARIDGRIGLDEELIIRNADLRARECRDDALRHGLPDAERIADREHQIAHLQRFRIAELETCRSVAFFKLSTARSVRGSRRTISASNSRRSDKRHLHLVHVLDDVIVGDDETRRIHDDTGTERTLRPRRRHARAALPEEPPIEILHAGILAPLGTAGIDVHHRAAGGANDGRERQLNLRLALRNRAAPAPARPKGLRGRQLVARRKMAESAERSGRRPRSHR